MASFRSPGRAWTGAVEAGTEERTMLRSPRAIRVRLAIHLDPPRIPIPARRALVDEQPDLKELEEPVQGVVALIVRGLRHPYPVDYHEEGQEGRDRGGRRELVLLTRSAGDVRQPGAILSGDVRWRRSSGLQLRPDL
jgi:hypothetical protein